MELNEGADIQAKAGAALDEDRCWHETDFGGLLYQDLEEEEAYMRPGTCAKRFARDFLLQVEVGRCRDTITSQWLLRLGQGRQYLCQLWKETG
eukprot:1881129-Rhodomonas_salina.1